MEYENRHTLPGEMAGSEAIPVAKHEFDSVCGACGALLPAGCDTCLVCGEHRGASTYSGVFPTPEVDGRAAHYPEFPSDSKAHHSPELWRRWGAGLSAALLLVLVAIAGFGIYRQYFDTSNYRAAEAVLFEGASGRLMLSYPGLAQPREITGAPSVSPGTAGETACASPNGRWIAYTSDSGALMLIDLAQRNVLDTASFEAVRLANDVRGAARFTGDSDLLVYLSRSSELWGVNLSGECWSIDTGVSRVLAVEGDKVLYARQGDKTGQLDLYITSAEQNAGEWILIGRNVTEVLDWTSGFERLFYTARRQDGETGQQTTALQLYKSGSGPANNTTVTVGTNVGAVLSVSAAQETAVWFAPQQQEWTLSTFLHDDLAARDRRTREPELEDYPLVEWATYVYGAGADFTDLTQDEELLLQNEQYRQAMKDWEDKQIRDQLRENLEKRFAATGIDQQVGELYVYRNGEAILLDTGVWGEDGLTAENGAVNAEKGFVVYRKLELSTLQRLKMSENWQWLQQNELDFEDYLLEETGQQLVYATLSGSRSRLYVSNDSSIFDQWMATPDADGVYFTVRSRPAHKESAGALYYAPVKGGAPGTATLLQRGVSSLKATVKNGALFYGSEQIYLAQGASVQSVGSMGGGMEVLAQVDGSLLLLCPDPRPANTGNLVLVGREWRQLADRVLQVELRAHDLIYFLKRREDGRIQDLYIWHDARETLVERDVHDILRMPGAPARRIAL